MARVLCIDDSAVVLDSLADTLEGCGYEVRLAESGAAGLAMLEHFQPEVVVSDLDMPGLNGIQLVQAMKVHAPLVPVIILTSNAEAEQIVTAMREGAHGYLVKGASEGMIVQELESALRHRQLLDANLRLEQENQTYQQGLEKMVEEKSAEIGRLQALKSQAEKLSAMGTLVAGVAHEINNPLAVVIANLKSMEGDITDLQGLLNDRPAPTGVPAWGRLRETLADSIPTLRESIDSSNRIARLVKSLKRLAVPNTERGQCELRTAVEQAMVIARPELLGKAEPTFALDPALKEFPLSEDELITVLGNLLINSAHAIRERGVVAVQATLSGNDATLSVSDTGCGIPRENLAKVCEPFFSTKSPGKGMGLGMNLVYQIVSRAFGTVEIASEVGVGTTISIKVPRPHARRADVHAS